MCDIIFYHKIFEQLKDKRIFHITIFTYIILHYVKICRRLFSSKIMYKRETKIYTYMSLFKYNTIFLYGINFVSYVQR